MAFDGSNHAHQKDLLSLEDALCISSSSRGFEDHDATLLDALQHTTLAQDTSTDCMSDDDTSEKVAFMMKTEDQQNQSDPMEQPTMATLFSPVFCSPQKSALPHQNDNASETSLPGNQSKFKQSRTDSNLHHRNHLVRAAIEKPNRESYIISRKPRHICSECGKEFKRAHNLKIHGRLHTGDKPFKCPFYHCNKTFRWKSSIVSHVNWHRTKRGDILPGETEDILDFGNGLQPRARMPNSAVRVLNGSEIDAIQRKHNESRARESRLQQNSFEVSSDVRHKLHHEGTNMFIEDLLPPERDGEPTQSPAIYNASVPAGHDDGTTTVTPSTTSGSFQASPALMDAEDLESLVPLFPMLGLTGEQALNGDRMKSDDGQTTTSNVIQPSFAQQKFGAHSDVLISSDPFPFLDDSPI